MFGSIGGIAVCTFAFIHTRTADGIVTFGGIGVTVGWGDARLISGRA